ncbi:MAG: hypothetical protein WAT79_01785 [Saprospiraceae bacterium]
MSFSTVWLSKTFYLLCLAFVLCFVHYYFFHGGYLGYDELEYARLGVKIVEGDFVHDSLYAYRYFGFLPLSVLYFMVGIGDFANWLMPTLTLLLIIYIVLKLLPNTPIYVKLLSVLFLVFNPLHLLYLEKPMPDITVELGFLMCFFSYYKERYDPQKIEVNFRVFLFLFGFIIVFMSKETFLVFYPFFLFLFIVDIFQKRRKEFWLKVFTSISIFILIYLGLNYYYLGNPLARVEAIFLNRYISECTYELQPIAVLLERIGYRLWFDMTRVGFLWPLGFVFVFIDRWKHLERSLKFVLGSYVSLLLLSNFMTISYSSYVPLCNDPRHFLFILPIGALIWAMGWKLGLQFSKKEILGCLIIWSLQLLLSIWFSYEHTWALFLPLALGLMLIQEKKTINIGLSIVVLGMLAVYIQNVQYNQSTNHQGQKELIKKVLESGPQNKYILTDGANTNIGQFYAGYKDNNTFVVFKDYDPKIHKNRELYIIMNGMTAYLSNTDWDKVPEFVKTAQENLPVYYKNKAGVVYRIK